MPNANLDSTSTVGAVRCVHASLTKHKPLHWHAAHKVRLNDLLHVFKRNKPIPNRLWIDDDGRPMLALIQTSGLVDPNARFKPFALALPFQSIADCGSIFGATASARVVHGPLVRTNKYMSVKPWHLLSIRSFRPWQRDCVALRCQSRVACHRNPDDRTQARRNQ